MEEKMKKIGINREHEKKDIEECKRNICFTVSTRSNLERFQIFDIN